MDIIDFLPTYTEFDKDVETILGPDLVDTTSLYHKKEFHDFRLQAIEKRPEKPGEYMNHQIIMARFLSSYTPYNGILVMHEPGTGKTCVSVAVIEKIRSEKSSFRGALILMKGKNLIENYKKELVEKCTDGRYKINDDEDGDEKKVGYDNPGSLTANKVRRRINKKLEKFYQFQTFETFSKQLSKMSDKDIIKNYSNKKI
jgi:superfamily II DNA or RNA helicase